MDRNKFWARVVLIITIGFVLIGGTIASCEHYTKTKMGKIEQNTNNYRPHSQVCFFSDG